VGHSFPAGRKAIFIWYYFAPSEAAIDLSQESINMTNSTGKETEYSKHPYLAGNFRPVRLELDLVPCEILQGLIPHELAGGQYLRNGANAYYPPAPGEGYHL